MASPEWITLTRAMLISVLSKRERDDFGKTETEAPGDDRIPVILANLTAEIRDHIQSWSQNTLSADPSKLPPGVIAHALAVARHRLLTTIPNFSPGQARVDEFKEANIHLNKLAEGKIRPAPAPDAIPNDVPLAEPGRGVSWTAPGLRTGRARTNGL